MSQNFKSYLAVAKKLDGNDRLKKFRKLFHLPKLNGKTALYFTGNSLGLQPISTKKFLNEELSDWANLGVEGHLHGNRPWLYYHKFSKAMLAKLVGGKPTEVIAMNQLTVNLHLMLISFYTPNSKRYKIITEAGAFSSDQYAFESQMKLHNINPKDALIELKPRQGEYSLRTEDIEEAIMANKNDLALVIFGAVQYYTGQFFNIKKITAAAHKAGAIAGFDLAHAIGNVPMQLHKNQVDFAVWCSYKYLNAGPGGVAGAFVHENHFNNREIKRLAGWWGHAEKERFEMKKGFVPMAGVDGWQLSNFPILSGAALLASLAIFKEAEIKKLREKSLLLTAFLEFLLKEIDPDQNKFIILTSEDPQQRGCQLSILTMQNGKQLFKKITQAGVIADWREPGVIRIAPVPLYNSFEDVFKFAEIFKRELAK